jgi:hypothetical protein
MRSWSLRTSRLPAYSPELNPLENLWHYPRSHYWSLRVYRDYESRNEAAVIAWRALCLVPELIRSVCAAPNRRAGCEELARLVRREGRLIDMSLPYPLFK